ncbi:MAG: hypothetical protein FWF76_03895 [Oscillospiraceae bacterium]|nr:hypothetical protein [Oscillospiraceae bacterium]
METPNIRNKKILIGIIGIKVDCQSTVDMVRTAKKYICCDSIKAMIYPEIIQNSDILFFIPNNFERINIKEKIPKVKKVDSKSYKKKTVNSLVNKKNPIYIIDLAISMNKIFWNTHLINARLNTVWPPRLNIYVCSIKTSEIFLKIVDMNMTIIAILNKTLKTGKYTSSVKGSSELP